MNSLCNPVSHGRMPEVHGHSSRRRLVFGVGGFCWGCGFGFFVLGFGFRVLYYWVCPGDSGVDLGGDGF